MKSLNEKIQWSRKYKDDGLIAVRYVREAVEGLKKDIIDLQYKNVKSPLVGALLDKVLEKIQTRFGDLK